MAIKMVAFGVRPYFRSGWNSFDCFVVGISWLGAGVDLGSTENLPFLPLLRILRVVRIFKLIRSAKGLQLLLQTLIFSLPALGNVASVVFLFFYIYAIVVRLRL